MRYLNRTAVLFLVASCQISAPAQSLKEADAALKANNVPVWVSNLRALANQNEPNAEAILSVAYAGGLWGLEKNESKALVLLKKSSDAGSMLGLALLGLAYSDGSLGLLKNYAVARRFLEKSKEAPRSDDLHDFNLLIRLSVETTLRNLSNADKTSPQQGEGSAPERDSIQAQAQVNTAAQIPPPSVSDQIVPERNEVVIAIPNFQLSAVSLKRGTKGVDIVALASALEKSPPPEKSEFETVAQFEARTSKWEKRPILRDIGPDSRVAFITTILNLPTSDFVGRPGGAVSYDAELEEMTIQMSSSNVCEGLVLSQSKKYLDQYSATNGFGAKISVQRVAERRWCLLMAGSQKASELFDRTLTVKIPRNEALVAKYAMGIAIIGRLSEPYFNVNQAHSSPSFKTPIDKEISTYSIGFEVESLWIVNTLSGKVYEKIPV